jgi:AAA ATPase domain/Protein of unknown function (DUF3696)
MTITNMRVQNFKSWRDTKEMRLAPITGLFGTNSSGKTALLQFLVLLKQTSESPDLSQVLNLNAKGSIELGTFLDVLYNHDPSNVLSFHLGWDDKPERIVTRRKSTPRDGPWEHFDFKAEIGWQERKGQAPGNMVDRQFSYGFYGTTLGMRRKSDDQEGYEITGGLPDAQVAPARHRAANLPPPGHFYQFPERAYAGSDIEFLDKLQLQLGTQLTRLVYLESPRSRFDRQHLRAGNLPTDVGIDGSRTADVLIHSRADGHNISQGRGKNPITLEERVALWLKTLGLVQSFSVKETTKGSDIYEIWVRRTAASAEVRISEVGFGVSQVLPVITECYWAPAGQTLLLEHPDVHLHPSAQTGLADVFIDAVKTRNIQIVLESHSEHMLRRLQRRIAEGELDSKDVALYFCRMENGESQLDELELNEVGNITNWPKNFFGDQFGEMAAMSDAALERKH